MRPTTRHRLTVCLSTAAATAVLGVLLAPAATAAPDQDRVLPNQYWQKSNAPLVASDVPALGRKWG